MRVDELFDFFIASGGEGAGLGEEGARLREVHLRLVEAGELPGPQARCAKTIAVLNLISSGGPRRAARGMLHAAIADDGLITDEAIGDALKALERSGVVVYREFADEYRVWRGSDFDVSAAVSTRRDQLEHGLGPGELPLAEIARSQALRPAVAARHTQQTGTLRYFEQRYVGSVPEATDIHCMSQAADGLILRVLGDAPAIPAPSTTADGKPLVIIASPYADEVRAAALDAAATLQTVGSASELKEDPVARAEVRHRSAQAQELLAGRLGAAFDPERKGVSWHTDGATIAARRTTELSRLLSDLCDRAYPKTPVIRSEMLNRDELTSQGAGARRDLNVAMFARPGVDRLGIEGFGPERAIYEALLASTGIHRVRDGRTRLWFASQAQRHHRRLGGDRALSRPRYGSDPWPR